MSTILNQIRKAIESAGETPYSIAKGSGVNRSQISRLLSGEFGLSIDAAERLADYLGYQITLAPKRKTTRGR